MSYTVSYEQAETHVEAVVSGEVRTYDELEALVDEFTRELIASGLSRFLLKEREFQLLVDVYDVVTLTRHVSQDMTQTLGLKVASHYAPCNAEVNAAFETCHQNRSLNFRAFSCVDDAREWLLS